MRPVRPPRRVSASAGRPLRTNCSTLSTSASARSTRAEESTSSRVGAAVSPAPAAAACGSAACAASRPGRVSGARVASAPSSRRATCSRWSAARSSSVPRASSRAVAWVVATAPSAMRLRAASSISVRARSRSSAATHTALRLDVLPGPRAMGAVGDRPRVPGATRCRARSVWARRSSSKRFAGGGGGCGLRGGSTRSDSILRRCSTRFVPVGISLRGQQSRPPAGTTVRFVEDATRAGKVQSSARAVCHRGAAPFPWLRRSLRTALPTGWCGGVGTTV